MTPIDNCALPSVDDCLLMDLPRIPRREGNITVVTGTDDLPFDVQRVYYLYDIPGGASRGGHGHKNLQQLVVAVMGGCDVVLDDGARTRTVTLNRAHHGLYIPPLLWRDLRNFLTGTVCLVLASQPYDESDYFRSYNEFLTRRKELRGQ
jgi:WxcM-like, C-terminal